MIRYWHLLVLTYKINKNESSNEIINEMKEEKANLKHEINNLKLIELYFESYPQILPTSFHLISTYLESYKDSYNSTIFYKLLFGIVFISISSAFLIKNTFKFYKVDLSSIFIIISLISNLIFLALRLFLISFCLLFYFKMSCIGILFVPIFFYLVLSVIAYFCRKISKIRVDFNLFQIIFAFKNFYMVKMFSLFSFLIAYLQLNLLITLIFDEFCSQENSFTINHVININTVYLQLYTKKLSNKMHLHRNYTFLCELNTSYKVEVTRLENKQIYLQLVIFFFYWIAYFMRFYNQQVVDKFVEINSQSFRPDLYFLLLPSNRILFQIEESSIIPVEISDQNIADISISINDNNNDILNEIEFIDQ